MYIGVAADSAHPWTTIFDEVHAVRSRWTFHILFVSPCFVPMYLCSYLLRVHFIDVRSSWGGSLCPEGVRTNTWIDVTMYILFCDFPLFYGCEFPLPMLDDVHCNLMLDDCFDSPSPSGSASPFLWFLVYIRGGCPRVTFNLFCCRASARDRKCNIN